eukprot:15484637-Alexandrium_andersonii.AAC.1
MEQAAARLPASPWLGDWARRLGGCGGRCAAAGPHSGVLSAAAFVVAGVALARSGSGAGRA